MDGQFHAEIYSRQRNKEDLFSDYNLINLRIVNQQIREILVKRISNWHLT